MRVDGHTLEEMGSAKASSIRVPLERLARATKPAVIECSDEPVTETLSSGERAG